MTTPCMGGWCAVRDNCKHYHSESRAKPIERLCEAATHTAFRPVAHDAFEARYPVIPLKEAA